MEITINDTQIIKTKLTLEEIAKRIQENAIEIFADGIVNWGKVWSVNTK